jgi:N-acetyl-alpha-D-muramate 1-phosphate uridylyltransferase
MKAMILAAGLGTRLKPFTEQHPKALAEVNGKTLLQRNIEYLASFGIRDIIVNVHHFASQIEHYLQENNDFGSRISISDERKEVLETGGGLKKAGHFFEDPSDAFVLMNVDILTNMDLSQMIAQHNKHHPLVTLAVTNRQTSRYFLFDDAGILCGWENINTGEKKIARVAKNYVQKAFSGIHVISPAIFPLMSRSGKFSLVDAYLDLAKSETIMAFDHSGSKFIDVGKPESLTTAGQVFL